MKITEERETIKLVKYVDEDEAKKKLKDYLFNPKIKPDPDILNDEGIFYKLQDGLDDEQKDWLREKRQTLINALKAKV